MSFRKCALILLLGISMPAMSQLTTLVRSVEASTSVMNVPTTPSGRLAFKPCTGRCDADYISVRLTADTRFVVQGKAVDFSEFRRDFYNRRHSSDGYALVSYDTEKNTVTSVEITF